MAVVDGVVEVAVVHVFPVEFVSEDRVLDSLRFLDFLDLVDDGLFGKATS